MLSSYSSGFVITYINDQVRNDLLKLPTTLAARYVFLTRRMLAISPHLGAPHTKALGHGLMELRLKGKEGIARVFFCVTAEKRIVMLHSFIKKTDRTPQKELHTAMKRFKDLNNGNT